MDVQIVSSETTQPVFAELKRRLPRMAQLLGVEANELQILDYDWFPREYMTTKHRDPVVACEGPLEGMPHIQKRRLQVPGAVGYGIYVHQCRLDAELQYCTFTARGNMWDETYLIIPKGKLYRLRRMATRLNRLAGQITEIPILREGLLDEIVQNTIGFLLRSKDIEKYGVKIKRGIILDGLPGNGKTMVCRHIQKLCSQNGFRWGIITSADIDQAYADKELNDLFQRYTVSFFDDIDISYMDRSKGNGKMACSLLTAMDGLVDGGHLVRIFTTNEKVDGLDKAFTRPGRIDKCITLDKPDADLRRKLISEIWPTEIRENISVDDCVEWSGDFSFAELEAIRTFLVTNFVLGDGTWDLEGAFGEFEERRAEKKTMQNMGFGNDSKKKRRKKKAPTLKVEADSPQEGGESS